MSCENGFDVEKISASEIDAYCRKNVKKGKNTEINIYYEQRSKAAAYVQQVQENDFLELLENKNGRGSLFCRGLFWKESWKIFVAQFLQPFDHLRYRWRS